MLDAALAASALLMGLAGTPHCLVMCGAVCTGLTGRSRPALLGFMVGRLFSYSLAGAAAAASVGVLAQLSQSAALLRPVWVLLHVAAILLGLSLLWRGRQPAWLEGLGQRVARQIHVPVAGLSGGAAVLGAPTRAGLFGLAWAAWPCGLLQSALLVAALASGPLQGAGVMATFALASGLGLLIGPALLTQLQRLGPGLSASGMRLSVRLSGLGLALASGWALGHGVWQQVVAFCS